MPLNSLWLCEVISSYSIDFSMHIISGTQNTTRTISISCLSLCILIFFTAKSRCTVPFFYRCSPMLLANGITIPVIKACGAAFWARKKNRAQLFLFLSPDYSSNVSICIIIRTHFDKHSVGQDTLKSTTHRLFLFFYTVLLVYTNSLTVNLFTTPTVVGNFPFTDRENWGRKKVAC